MSSKHLHPLPTRDPVSGKPLFISELTCEESGISIRGRFEIPSYSMLEPDQAYLLESFLRCRGVLSAMERELGLSYPTVRARLDAMIVSLDLPPARDELKKTSARRSAERNQEVLDQLEKGEISAEEAKAKLRQTAQ